MAPTQQLPPTPAPTGSSSSSRARPTTTSTKLVNSSGSGSSSKGRAGNGRRSPSSSTATKAAMAAGAPPLVASLPSRSSSYSTPVGRASTSAYNVSGANADFESVRRAMVEPSSSTKSGVGSSLGHVGPWKLPSFEWSSSAGGPLMAEHSLTAGDGGAVPSNAALEGSSSELGHGLLLAGSSSTAVKGSSVGKSDQATSSTGYLDGTFSKAPLSGRSSTSPERMSKLATRPKRQSRSPVAANCPGVERPHRTSSSILGLQTMPGPPPPSPSMDPQSEDAALTNTSSASLRRLSTGLTAESGQIRPLHLSNPSSPIKPVNDNSARREPSLPSTLPASRKIGSKEMRRPSLFSLRSTASSSSTVAAPPVPPPLRSRSSTMGGTIGHSPTPAPISTFTKLRDSVFSVVMPSSAAAARERERLGTAPSSTLLVPRPDGAVTPEVVQTPPPMDTDDDDEVLADSSGSGSYFPPSNAGGPRSGARFSRPMPQKAGSGSSASLLSARSVPGSPRMATTSMATTPTTASGSGRSSTPEVERRALAQSAAASPRRPTSSSLLDLPTPSAAGVSTVGRTKLRPRSSTDPPVPDNRLLLAPSGHTTRSPLRRESASAGSPGRSSSRPLSIRRLSSSLFQGGGSAGSSSSASLAGPQQATGNGGQPDFGALFGGSSPRSRSPSKPFSLPRGLATPPIVEDRIANPTAAALSPFAPSFGISPAPHPSRQSSASSLAHGPPGSTSFAEPRPILRRGSSVGSAGARRNSLASSTGSWSASRPGSSSVVHLGGVSSGGSRRGSDDVRKWEDEVPRREEAEGVDEWLSRLREVVPRSEIASILASNGDEFHTAALRNYMLTFDLSLLPLDIALRRLLMEVSLPRETQQIDRVMEAFAKQYLTSNPGLFVSEDQPYILAFSLIMLHTDAFNKSNKNKMTKADYARNTRLDGVNRLVLDTFFDNITFTPFVFIEDDLDVNGSRSLTADSGPSSLSGTSPFGFSTTPTTSFLAAARPPSSNKIDVYHLISTGQVLTLRCAEIASQIPRKTPFSYHGPRGFFDTGELHASFAEADMIEVGDSSANGAGGLGDGNHRGATSARADGKSHSLKLTKYGVLSRKEETIEGGRKSSNRKWREWSVILTGSQLLFFKDTTWALVLRNQAEERVGQRTPGGGGRLLLPRMASFRPDEILSVKDCIAITDTTYSKYANAFRFVMPHGRQYILQAGDDEELGQWMSRINYAAAFKTASVRMRGMGMTGGQAQMAGAAAAASHAKALKSESVGPLSIRTNDSGFFSATQNRSAGRPRASTSTLDAYTSSSIGSTTSSQLAPPSTAKPGFTSRLRASSKPPEIALESPIGPSIDSGEQLESAFIEVKAELAAGRGGVPRLASTSAGSSVVDLNRQNSVRARAASVGGLPDAMQPGSARASFEKLRGGPGVELAEFGAAGRSNHASRAEAIQLKVDQLKERIRATEQQLDAELRTTRNLGILAPFRKATRERIGAIVPALAKKIRTLRLELARFRCYEEILEKDLRIEEDEWKLVKHIAHQAARSSLSGNHTHATPTRQSSLPPARLVIPDLEVSMHTGLTPPPPKFTGSNGFSSAPPLVPTTPPPSAHALRRQPSSIASDSASFHSAVDDFQVNSLNTADDDAALLIAKDDIFGAKSSEARRPSMDDELLPPSWPAPLLDAGPPTPPATRFLPSSDRSLHPSAKPLLATGEEESAEAWSQTRAGKRVSLAEVPTETVRRISLQLKRNSVEDIRRRAARESRQSSLRPEAVTALATVDPALAAPIAQNATTDDDVTDTASLLTIDTIIPDPSSRDLQPDRILALPISPS